MANCDLKDGLRKEVSSLCGSYHSHDLHPTGVEGREAAVGCANLWNGTISYTSLLNIAQIHTLPPYDDLAFVAFEKHVEK